MIEILLTVITLLTIWSIFIYNRLIGDKNRVSEGWSGIDVQLKLRHNLVPNLVSATKQYASYEQAVLTTVIELRSQSEAVTNVGQKGQLEEQLGYGLQKIMALVEQYPDLKANASFIKLQQELIDVEEHIQYARRYYNGAVRNYNINIERFPNLIIANLFNFSRSDFFQLESDDMRKAPSVK